MAPFVWAGCRCRAQRLLMPGSGVLRGGCAAAWAPQHRPGSAAASPSLSVPQGEMPRQQQPRGHRAGQKQRCVRGGQPEQQPLSAAQPRPGRASWGQRTPTRTPSQSWASGLVRCCREAADSPGQGRAAGHHSLCLPPHNRGCSTWGERLCVLPP